MRYVEEPALQLLNKVRVIPLGKENNSNEQHKRKRIGAVTASYCNTAARFIGLADFRQGIYSLAIMH